jgi:hypothetical protein
VRNYWYRVHYRYQQILADFGVFVLTECSDLLSFGNIWGRFTYEGGLEPQAKRGFDSPHPLFPPFFIDKSGAVRQ